ncbi:MAG: Pup--protein ligase [Actinomycetaceae bacterium]|nr:Pup--protein ligase [Actinomycetaceae bacterium]
MIRRIMGIETEYGLTCFSPHVDEVKTAEEVAQLLFRPVVQKSHSTNLFLPNGGRLYLDVGAHPEYATAECDNVRDLIAQDRAGDMLFSEMVRDANEELAREGSQAQIHLFKNNSDSHGHSYGCHENYLVRRSRNFRAHISSMIPFYVTRQIVCGAGNIYVNENGEAHYEFSARADQMFDAISAASTRTRPMVNTRDEPHADSDHYRRMHVIVGDSNMSQITTALKVVMTDLILMMFDAGGELPDLSLKDPVDAIRVVSKDMSGKTPLEGSSSSYCALDIQRIIYEKTLSFLKEKGYEADFSDDYKYFIDLWERVLVGVENENWQSISAEIDWAAKYFLLHRYKERSLREWNDPAILRLNLAYHDVTSAGLRASMEKQGLLKTFVDADKIEEATRVPPQTTRAVLRGAFIDKAWKTRKDYVTDWMNLRLLEAKGTRSILLKDPFATKDENFEELMREMDQK